MELNPRRSAGVSGRVPPHNIEAEQSVLGGVLFDNSSLPKVIESIKTGEEFYKPAHKVIFESYIALFEKGEPIDLMTVSEYLRKNEKLNESGGIDYIASIMEATPTAANVGVHARIVKEKSLLRKLIYTAGELVNLGFEDTNDVDEVIERAERMVFELAEDRVQSGFTDIKNVVEETNAYIEKMSERKELVTGLRTGYKKLDEKTAGLQGGDLIIVAGRPSMGKTALCINIAENVSVDEDKIVAFFSLEMNAQQLVLRMLSSLSQIPMQKIRTGFVGQNDWSRLTSASGRLYDSHIHIDDTPMQSALEIRSKARRLKAEKGLDLIIIDYLQLLTPSGKSESRVLEIGEITRSLKGVARELDVPVILISQLSRKVEERPDKRPLLSDLRESGSIEQDADVVGFVYREEYYHPDKVEAHGKAEFIIAKQRNGPVGRIELAFRSEYTRFENISHDVPDFDQMDDEE